MMRKTAVFGAFLGVFAWGTGVVLGAATLDFGAQEGVPVPEIGLVAATNGAGWDLVKYGVDEIGVKFKADDVLPSSAVLRWKGGDHYYFQRLDLSGAEVGEFVDCSFSVEGLEAGGWGGGGRTESEFSEDLSQFREVEVQVCRRGMAAQRYEVEGFYLAKNGEPFDPLQRYTVRFEWHGGSDEAEYGYGDEPEIPEIPEEGMRYIEGGMIYTFADWAPEVAEVTGDAVYAAAYDSAPATQTVTFNPTEGTCDVATKTVDIGGTYGTMPVPKRNGFAYKGWWTAASGGKRVYAGSIVSEQATRTLYAHWTSSQTVTFDANDGTCDVETKTVAIGGTYGAMPVPVREGYAYAGWWTAPEGGKRVYAGSTVNATDSRTLYAHWMTTQTVTFDANDGTGATETKTVDIGGTYGTMPVPTREGYVYMGWWTAPEGGKRVYAGSTVAGKSTLTLYAHWSDNLTQTVTFDANGGTCAVETKTVEIGGTYGTMPVPKRDGFAYKGWWTAADGGTRVYAGSEVTAKPTRTLYAHWEEGEPALSISGFAMSRRAYGARGAREATVEYTLWFETVADAVYEVQWTPSLGGEWTALERWVAGEDGETEITVSISADAPTGFFRLVQPDTDGGPEGGPREAVREEDEDDGAAPGGASRANGLQE